MRDHQPALDYAAGEISMSRAIERLIRIEKAAIEKTAGRFAGYFGVPMEEARSETVHALWKLFCSWDPSRGPLRKRLRILWDRAVDVGVSLYGWKREGPQGQRRDPRLRYVPIDDLNGADAKALSVHLVEEEELAHHEDLVAADVVKGDLLYAMQRTGSYRRAIAEVVASYPDIPRSRIWHRARKLKRDLIEKITKGDAMAARTQTAKSRSKKRPPPAAKKASTKKRSAKKRPVKKSAAEEVEEKTPKKSSRTRKKRSASKKTPAKSTRTRERRPAKKKANGSAGKAKVASDAKPKKSSKKVKETKENLSDSDILRLCEEAAELYRVQEKSEINRAFEIGRRLVAIKTSGIKHGQFIHLCQTRITDIRGEPMSRQWANKAMRYWRTFKEDPDRALKVGLYRLDLAYSLGEEKAMEVLTKGVPFEVLNEFEEVVEKRVPIEDLSCSKIKEWAKAYKRAKSDVSAMEQVVKDMKSLAKKAQKFMDEHEETLHSQEFSNDTTGAKKLFTAELKKTANIFKDIGTILKSHKKKS